MTIQQLRILGFLAEYKSITKAADYCFLSQSALTRQIRAMEAELGFELLVRHFGGVRFTPAGEAFYEATLPIIASYDAAVIKGRMACSLPPQIKLRIGVYNYSLSFISSLCKFCESQLPNITFDFISCRMKDSAKYLSDNLLDLCFPAEYQSTFDGIGHEDLLSSKNYCLIPKGHALYGKKHLSMQDLDGQSVLLLPAGQAANADRLRAELTAHCKEIQIVDYQSPIEADAMMLSKHYILMTLGLFEQKKDVSAAVLSDFPGVTLSALYRQSDESFIRPVLDALHAHIDQALHTSTSMSRLP